MAKFQVVKTITYDLSAEIDVEVNTVDELLDLLDREGSSWIDWEQSDGQDEALEAFMLD